MAGRFAPVVLTVLGMVSIQVGAALAKSLFPRIGADGAVALRLTLAAAVLLVVWRPWRTPLTRERLIAIGFYGLTLGAMNLCFYLALATVPLGVAVALELIGPLTLALVMSHHRLDLLWVATAALGVVLLLPLRGDYSTVSWDGVRLALAAGVFWALYIVFGTKAGRTERGQAASLGMLTAAIIGAPVGVIHAGAALFAPDLLLLGLGVALLSSVIPYTIELYTMTRMPTRTFGVLMSLEPAIAALSGAALLSEHLNLTQWGGLAGVIAASAGATLTGHSRTAATP